MSSNQRLGLIALAAVLIGAAFVLLRPTEEGIRSGDPEPTEVTPPTKTRRAEAKPRQVAKVNIRDGRPAGGVRTISFRTGETGRIDVTSNTPSGIHLHGYDIERPVSPGKTTRVRFKANIEGVFELEDHDGGQRLASVKVSPR